MTQASSTYGCDAMREAIARLRQDFVPGSSPSHAPTRAAEALAATFDLWRARDFPDRRTALAQIAAAFRWSIELLDESIDALLAPFSRGALMSFASTILPRARLGGFVMPANVPGAGIHELVVALLSGSAAIVKTSNREPTFFHAFAPTLRKIDSRIGGLVEVATFGREREDLTGLMLDECDYIVALGDDASIAQIAGRARVFGFGSRTSGALISLAEPANIARVATALARDVVLFEQQGCLSPHHVFIAAADDSAARDFSAFLGKVLTGLAEKIRPAKLSFQSAAAIRRVRERARWRIIGGHSGTLLEGDGMSWTVAYDPDASFTLSPGYRTVTVSTVRDADDFAARLAPVAERIEAFALAAQAPSRARFLDVLAGAGVTYVCDPGRMQSPPVNWPHGGGAFLDFLAAHDE